MNRFAQFRELSFEVESLPQSERCSLERYLAARLQVHHYKTRAWINAGHVQVDGFAAKAKRLVQPGQQIQVRIPPPQPHAAQPQDLPLPICHLDEDLVVVIKPAGMATHPGPGWWRGSCVNALLYAIQDWPGINGVAGPGIVHRLDRDTSGLLVFARSDRAHQALLQAVKERQFERGYLAWVQGQMQGQGTIAEPLGKDLLAPKRYAVRADGKAAITHYQVLQTRAERSLLKLRLETGRTHQIRVHLAHLGHPVWGDSLYGQPNRQTSSFMALHAQRLGFRHPCTGETLLFEAPPPAVWAQMDA